MSVAKAEGCELQETTGRLIVWLGKGRCWPKPGPEPLGTILGQFRPRNRCTGAEVTMQLFPSLA